MAKKKKHKFTVFDFMDVPKTNINDWETWLNGANNKELKVIKKLTAMLRSIKDIGIPIICIGNPKSPQGFYWGDYPRDYISEVYPDSENKKYIFLIVHIDHKFHIDLSVPLDCDYYNLTDSDIKQLEKFTNGFNELEKMSCE